MSFQLDKEAQIVPKMVTVGSEHQTAARRKIRVVRKHFGQKWKDLKNLICKQIPPNDILEEPEPSMIIKQDT